MDCIGKSDLDIMTVIIREFLRANSGIQKNGAKLTKNS